MDKLILGRYIPGDSIVHQLDPRVKLLGSIYFIFLLFFANNWQSYLFLAVFILVAIKLSKISLGFFLRGLKPLLWLIIFTVSLQLLFSRGGEIYFSFGPIAISQFGLINAALIFCRFVFIIFMSTLLTLTTIPLELTDAIEFILSPFKYVKLPVHEIALMISIALRFVPTLMDETTKIMNAQRARGVEFGEGNLFQQMKSIIPLLIPLFVSSFNRAEELATAMEARGYRGGEGRTKYRVLNWEVTDTMAVIVFAFVTVGVILLRG
ncbi:energy-coupling factor transport system permease protein [Isobaculum melis]|uniref:Energy-coupling factor transporter transmembrane protein EcfT n=2 Tax=Isobaculum melis TaxID=142588 RepID=A0A1H9SFF1_9LACT|nr:energy-coupling factor transport system permease protein [Isobaculum melis]